MMIERVITRVMLCARPMLRTVARVVSLPGVGQLQVTSYIPHAGLWTWRMWKENWKPSTSRAGCEEV